MMRWVISIAIVSALLQVSASAQDVPKAEFFGGLSFFRIDDRGLNSTPVGWQASLAKVVRRDFAVIGDFGGQYKSIAGEALRTHQFLGGVQLYHHVDNVTVFGHGLYGVNHFRGGALSQTNFMMGYGGGIDINNASRSIAVRVIQFDWLPTRSEGRWAKDLTRYGFGVVFRFD